MTKLAFRQPRSLPAEGWAGGVEEAEWVRCKKEATLWVTGRQTKEDRKTGAAAGVEAGDKGRQVEVLDSERRQQKKEYEEKGTQLSCDYNIWCNALERSALGHSSVHKVEWAKYMGRGSPPVLVVMDVGDNREGPIRGIKVEANQSAAGRLVATWANLLSNIARKPEVLVWRSALVKSLAGQEDETKKLIALAGYETHCRLVSSLREVASSTKARLEEGLARSATDRLKAVEKVVKRRKGQKKGKLTKRNGEDRRWRGEQDWRMPSPMPRMGKSSWNRALCWLSACQLLWPGNRLRSGATSGFARKRLKWPATRRPFKTLGSGP